MAILAGDLQYRPIYTTSHVLGELATLLLCYSHDVASRALHQIRDSPNVTVIHPDRMAFDAAVTAFDRYDDHTISLVDHLTGVLADERDVDHIFTFDTDFRTLELTLVPEIPVRCNDWLSDTQYAISPLRSFQDYRQSSSIARYISLADSLVQHNRSYSSDCCTRLSQSTYDNLPLSSGVQSIPAGYLCVIESVRKLSRTTSRRLYTPLILERSEYDPSLVNAHLVSSIDDAEQ